MSKKNHYKELLIKEKRLTQEIELSKVKIEYNLKAALNPENLFSFFEDKLEKHVPQNYEGEFDLKKYLISMSVDFLYEQVSSSFISKPEMKNTAQWKLIVKSVVDSFYIKNKAYVTDLVSEYIDKGIKKWTNK